MVNSVFRRVDRTMVWLCNSEPPRDSEWHAYVDAVRRAVGDCSAKRDFLRFLVVTDGGGPNATQRAMTTTDDLIKNTRTAVITCSRIARGIVTAFSWFDVRMKAFAPADVGKAFDFLELSRSEALAAWAATADLKCAVNSGVQTISLCEQAPMLRGERATLYPRL
jgi:hypothetical protein